ncbi:hypothetical protein [Pseudomonas sp. C9-3]|uniref:hypothetical protein n=1 Tax=Pseudomonas sp. C9-3 TaxID=3078264 RepID=UPI0028E4EC07|nr:hypothetical protein [Pseudomonas sp. C9-3]
MDVRGNIPDFATPILGAGGRVNDVWWRFLLQLLNRTGGQQGVDATELQVITERTEVVITENAALSASEVPTNGAAVIGQLFLEALAAAQVQIHQQQAAPADVSLVTIARPAALDVPAVPVHHRQQQEVAPVPSLRRREQDVELVAVARRYDQFHEVISCHGLQHDPDLHALATPTSAGFMSAADKAKLDAL